MRLVEKAPSREAKEALCFLLHSVIPGGASHCCSQSQKGEPCHGLRQKESVFCTTHVNNGAVTSSLSRNLVQYHAPLLKQMGVKVAESEKIVRESKTAAEAKASKKNAGAQVVVDFAKHSGVEKGTAQCRAFRHKNSKKLGGGEQCTKMVKVANYPDEVCHHHADEYEAWSNGGDQPINRVRALAQHNSNQGKSWKNDKLKQYWDVKLGTNVPFSAPPQAPAQQKEQSSMFDFFSSAPKQQPKQQPTIDSFFGPGKGWSSNEAGANPPVQKKKASEKKKGAGARETISVRMPDGRVEEVDASAFRKAMENVQDEMAAVGGDTNAAELLGF